MRGQEQGWAININKTLGQLSPRSSCSTRLMQGLEKNGFFFFFFKRVSIWLWVGGHTKGPQKGGRNLLPDWPEIVLLEAGLKPRDKQPSQGALGRPLLRGAGVLLVQSLEGLLVPGKGSQGIFLPQEI